MKVTTKVMGRGLLSLQSPRGWSLSSLVTGDEILLPASADGIQETSLSELST